MPFGSLWLPVLVSAVVVFILSSIFHMVIGHHKADYKGLRNEDEVRDALRRGSPAPGTYTVPYCKEMKDMKSPEMQKKWTDGPIAMLAISPNGAPNMGKYLGLWFVFCFIVSFLTAYVARITLNAGSDPMLILRLTSTVAFMGYGVGYGIDYIWKASPLANIVRAVIDALIYSLATGFIFKLLWPGTSGGW